VRAQRVFGGILAGTDGSASATEAVRRAARIAALVGAPLDVVFVIDTHHTHDGDFERDADAAASAASEAARAEHEDVRVRIVAGEPGAVLIDEASQHDSGLIAVGPDAGVLGGAVRVGRVAGHVLRQAPVSVLLGRAAPEGFPRRVECGVDGSDGSVATARLAASIAAAAGAELRLRHVDTVYPAEEAERTLDPSEPSPPEMEDAVREARAFGVEPVRATAMGRPERALVEAARRDDVDLLVVGHRGSSGVARALLGSVSEHVAAHASCSVLVVRPGEATG
jgi:nucleotide-binding universal stress UspA family protein